MGANLVAAVEAMYASDTSTDEWLKRLAEACRPIIDLHGLGIVAGLYSCPDPCSFTPTAAFMFGMSDALQAVFVEGLKGLSPAFVADAFLSRSCCLGTELRGWADVPPVKSGAMRDCGAVDSLQINAVDPDGGGCWICSPLGRETRLTDEAHIALTRLARHLAAANRLKRKRGEASLTEHDADAVLDVRGRMFKANGAAADPANRLALARGAQSMSDVRQRGDATDSKNLVDWEALVASRWTLVDDSNNDGRLLLAIDNRSTPPGLSLLSPRERDVVVRALRGDDNKVIAYDFGLAQSTVRVLIARASVKLGARSRKELLAKAAGLLESAGGDDRGA